MVISITFIFAAALYASLFSDAFLVTRNDNFSPALAKTLQKRSWMTGKNPDCKIFVDVIAPALQFDVREGGIDYDCCNKPTNRIIQCRRSGLEFTSKIYFIDLTNQQLHGRIPSEISLLKKLQLLRLSNNNLQGHIPTALGTLRYLEYFGAYSNKLMGNIPTEIGNLPMLRILDLRNNQLTGSIPSELGKLSTMSTLHLESNDLTGTIPMELTRLYRLQMLYLSNNRLNRPSEGFLTFTHTSLLFAIFEFEPQRHNQDIAIAPPKSFKLDKKLDDVCAVCYDDMDIGQNVVKGAQCTHHYHKECAENLIKAGRSGRSTPCPQCRKPLLF